MSDAGVFDLVAMGRSGVDLYPLQSEVGLEEVSKFGKFLGGSAANVSVAGAKHGLRTALISRTGLDPFGNYVRSELDRLGVSAQFVTPVADLNTPITFCEIFPPDNFPLYFYRDPIAPDLIIHPEELPIAAIQDAKIFWSTVTGLSKEPSRAAHHAAWAARGRKSHTILDLDYRPMFWDSEEEAQREVATALEHVTIAIGNQEECRIAVGETDPERAANALLDRGIELAVVKRGPNGVLAKTKTQRYEGPAVTVDVVNGLGAGDSFGGAFCHALLAGWPLEDIIQFANVAGAIVAGRLECSTAMPTTEEILTFIETATERSHG